MSRQVLTLFSLFSIATRCISARFIMMENFNRSRPSFEKYEEIRKEYLQEHYSRALGSDVELNAEEQQLNAIIMDLKADELARGFQNPFNFTPSRHFFEVYKTIESSPLFKLIEKMPKGLPSKISDFFKY